MTQQQPRHRIRIKVQTDYLPAQSSPEAERYVFAYTITIRNAGTEPARLLNRHWIITDANGKVQEVRGEGVVGEQPYLRPGESYRYTSGTMIATPVGSMQGSYEMVSETGEHFDAEIEPFSLSMPRTLH
jgi:ApaG protein